MNRSMLVVLAAVGVMGCATVSEAPEVILSPLVESNVTKPSVQVPTLKRKLAIVRFSNTTRYGKSLLYDGENDPLADQAKDMLMRRLVETGEFLVFERDNLDGLAFEQALSGSETEFNLVGVDAVIVGSVTEFGRTTEGQSGFLSSTKKQTAVATVEARLVDPRTGLAIFSASGSGDASVETGEVAGFGSKAAYDSSLNDAAISAAISNLTGKIIAKVNARRWSTDILKSSEGAVFISGGHSQGLKVGDVFAVETKGEVVKSGQSGLPITLPGKKVAEIKIVSFFGEDEYSEGAQAQLISGSLVGLNSSDLIVVEDVN